MIEVKKVVPELRFKGFNEEWLCKKISKLLVEGRLGGNYENSESNNGIPVIKMGNLGRGEININKVQYLPESSEFNNEDVLSKGDLLFNTRNTLELVGKVSIWREELAFALYNSNLMRMKFNGEIESSNVFMNYNFNTKNSINQLRRFATGTTSVAAIYGKDLKNLDVSFPSLPEQQKIASFLSAVDEKIQQLTRKKELLVQYKKGVMQQLFSGKLRFKDENGEEYADWTGECLGDFYNNLSTGMTPSRLKPNFFKGEIPWITSGELNYGFINETNEKISEEGKKDANLKLYKPNTMFIAITGLEAPGTRGKCAINAVPATTNQSCMAFEEKDNIDIFFLFQWYKYMGVRLFYQYAQGTKQQSFNNKLVQRFPFKLPILEEQKKIANFLSGIDTKTESTTHQISKMQTFKKGLLQKMFV
jgi:type I restriction enzyme S subunit